MKLTLHVWRQPSRNAAGRMVTYQANDVSPDMSFLEMLDVVNQELIHKGEDPIAFDHDCREGICGMCSLMIDGVPHGPWRGTTTCQLHMRAFKDGDAITIEPWRVKPFPVVKDLVVDRGSLDRIVEAGGFVSTNTGAAPDGNTIPIGKLVADRAFDAAECIACGACAAACKNGSASLYVAAKLAHLNSLPQGQPERHERTINMVDQHDDEGFGACTNTYDCQAACPKGITVNFIAEMNRDYVKASLKGTHKP